MKDAVAKFRTWLPGLLVALVGVAGVRVVAPQLSGVIQSGVTVVGYLLVPVGLALIARKIRQQAIMIQSVRH